MRSDRLVIGAIVVSVLAALTVVAFGFFSAPEGGETQYVYFALFGIPLALSMFFMPRATLVLLGALVYSVDWLSENWAVIPREATWLIDILIGLLILRTLILMPIRHQRMPGIEKLIFGILGFAILSAILNGNSQTTTLIGLRVGFRYVLLFVVAYNMNVTRRWLRGYILYLVFIGLIQTPVVIAQYIDMGWVDPDALSGTFGRGGTPAVAIFLLTIFCFMVARMIEDRRLHFWDLVMFTLMSISPIFGEVKFYFLFLPVLILFLIRAELFRRPAISFSLILIGAITIISVDYVIRSTEGWLEGRNPLTYVTKLYDVWQTETEEPTVERYERGYVLVSALHLARATPRDFILGNGPGSITMSYVSEDHSPKATRFQRWGLTSSVASFPWLLIEYGYVGVGLFGWLLWMIYRRGRILRSSAQRESRIYGRVLEGMTVLYAVWLLYINAWQSDNMNFIYWPLAAMFVYLSYQEEASRQAATVNERRLSQVPRQSAAMQTRL